MSTNNITCMNDLASLQLQRGAIQIADGVELENHVFLVSQLPCCAQIALPFWAKITGRIKNNRAEEVLLNIAVTLFDNEGSPLADYLDTIALEKEERGEFEVKLVEFHDRAKTYNIAIKETE